MRSARLINLHLAPMFDAALVASGASVDVRWLLRNKGGFPYLDIDLDDGSNTAVQHQHRHLLGDPAADQHSRSAALAAEGEAGSAWRRKPFVFASQAPTATGTTSASAVHIPYPQSSTVDWTYDAVSGLYRRSVQGEPHMDAGTNSQITAANVVVFYAPHGATSIVEDTLGNTAIQIGLTGPGKCLVLRDGLMTRRHLEVGRTVGSCHHRHGRYRSDPQKRRQDRADCRSRRLPGRFETRRHLGPGRPRAITRWKSSSA